MSSNKLKEKAISMRTKGASYDKISGLLNISKSTLSGWLKGVNLSEVQRNQLHRNKLDALKRARIKAAEWHSLQKENRIKLAVVQANQVLNKINLKNRNILELALAMLYLGEGTKKNPETSLGNSDPNVVKIFIDLLKKIYDIDTTKIRCELYIRADQSSAQLVRFWSGYLRLSPRQFKYIHKDKRTVSIPSFKNYKGVCMIRCSRVAIQRKLLNICKEFCDRIARP